MLYSLPFNVNVILLNSLVEDNIAAHNAGKDEIGARNIAAHNIAAQNDLSKQHRSTPPQVVLHSLPLNLDIILLHTAPPQVVLTAKPKELMVERVLLRGLLLVLRRLKQLEQHLRSTPPQVVLHSLPFDLDIILLHTAPPQVVLTAKPTELMVERVLLRGLLLVLRRLAANASS